MKLDYSPGEGDQFFSRIFYCADDACPVDTFVLLTPGRNISSVSIHTSSIVLSIGNYTFPRKGLDHVISINSSTSNDAKMPIFITSNITGSHLILNSFVSIKQPVTGSAISTIYWSVNSFKAKLPSMTFSVLNTFFVAPVVINNDTGLTFEASDVYLFSQYNVYITGSSQPGNTWRDFAMRINGNFETGTPSSFTSDVEAYAHEYIRIKIEEAQDRLSNAQSAVLHTESVMLHYNMTLEEKQNNLTTLDGMYTRAMDKISQTALALKKAQELFDNTNTSVLEATSILHQICQEMECPNMCLSTVSYTSFDNHMMLNNWGVKSANKKLLKYKKALVTEKQWNIQHVCRIITKIRGWAEFSFGQVCNYKAMISNVTHETGITESVNTTHIQGAVVGALDYIANQAYFNQGEHCGAQQLDYKCAVSNVGCQIAQGAAYDTFNVTQKALVSPLFQLSNAKIKHAIALIELSEVSMEINVTKATINQTQQMLKRVQKQHQIAVEKSESIQQNLHLTQVIGKYLKNSTLQQLLSLTNASFIANVSDDTTSSLILADITCNIPLTNSYFNVITSIDLTAPLSLLKRDLANKILSSLGAKLDDKVNVSSQPISMLYFNKHQFQSKCASLNNTGNFLLQLNQSLNLTLSKAEESKANISQTAMSISSIIASLNFLNFTHVNFTYLRDTYRTTLEPDILLNQSKRNAVVTNFTLALMSLRQSILLQRLKVDENLFLSWQVGIASLYDTGITSVDNISCYGFADCLAVTINLLQNLIVDAPSDAIDHNLLTLLSTVKKPLLQLSHSTSLTLSQAASITNEVSSIVHQLLQYWCSELPLIIRHPNNAVHVAQNKALTLECSAESVQSVRYVWRKDGFTLEDSSTPIFTISKTTLLDEGQYQCIAGNDVGRVESHLSNVFIIIPPSIILSPSNTTTFEGSDNGGWLACNATGRPTPGYQWLYSQDKHKWSTVINSASNELLIVKPHLSQEGWYKCRAFIGEYEVYSNEAYLTVRRASISTLNFPLNFVMVRINRNPQVTTSNLELVMDTLHYDFMYNYTQKNQISMQYFQVTYGPGNKTVDVETGFSSGFNYSLFIPICDQANELYPYISKLTRSTRNFQKELPIINFYIEDMLYISVRKSLYIDNLQYLCPTGQGVLDGNFICSEL